MPSNPHIIIIGGGASGIILVRQLLHFHPSAHISIVEKKNPWGAGVAYNTPYDFHVLNVRAANMSAFPGKPDDFVNWLKEKKLPYSGAGFVPRKIYGDYLCELAELPAGKKEQVRFIRDEALRVEKRLVHLASGETLRGDFIVIAAGNFLPTKPAAVRDEIAQDKNYHPDPWNYTDLENIGPAEDVLIIGSGLTMTDVALFLHHRGHTGEITSLSIHGFAPEVHGTHISPNETFRDEMRACETLSGYLRTWKKYAASGIGAESLAASIRPFVQELWLKISIPERRQFIEHLRHFWGTARHRVPEQCFSVLEKMQPGQLRFIGGRIKVIGKSAGRFEIFYVPRSYATTTSVKAHHIINCTGPSLHYEKDAPVFLRTMLEEGLVCRDPLRLGLDADSTGQLINPKGGLHADLFAMGSLLRGTLWEITSVPDIRVQAEKLAKLLLGL
ncbi:MAG: FAD-dependent pyridine nucleotide-disulfide oxidoreductase [Bacteroidetes bacterium]|nr:MAG: FAD-dependent pyridine nucleotide-disulfide oxidoreductase [Bacteroidota bacterium]